MPYIGNDLATQFQAFATQTITGDGSTGYTLDRAVANGKELLVYINNVKQEEGSGKSYTASGTTITFSEAVASGDSCYLVYMGSAQQTVVPPDGSVTTAKLGTLTDVTLTGDLTLGHDGAIINFGTDSDITLTHNHNAGLTLTGTGHTFSSDTYNIIKIQTDSNDDGSSDDAILQWTNGSSNTVKGEVRYDESESMFEIGAGDNQGHIRIDANGHVLMPNQSAFFAHANTAQSNLSTGGQVTIQFQTERFDLNSDYDTSTYTFTAPVTGKYQLNANVRLNALDSSASYYIIYIVTSNKNYFMIFDPTRFSEDVTFWNLNQSVLVDMDASDTAKVRFFQPNGTAQTDIDGGTGDTPSNFSGYLVA